MATLLNIQSSPNIETSASRAVSKVFVESYVSLHPGTSVIELDLVASPPDHLNQHHVGAFFAPPEAHSPENAAALKNSDRYVDQLMAADVVVLGSPMHNFGVASVMKSWVDNVVRLGTTFRYNEVGAVVGLMPQKKIVIVVGCGGVYSEGPMQPLDHAARYLADIFGFLGMTDVTVIHAEGLAMGPDMAAKGLAAAKSKAEAAAV